MAPLSEHEQKILDEIEASLKDEPARRNATPAGSSSSHVRRFRLGILLFIVGFVLLFTFFMTRQVIVGVLAFGGMVAGIVVMAGAGRGYLTTSGGPAGIARDKLARSFKSWEDSLRQRHRRE